MSTTVLKPSELTYLLEHTIPAGLNVLVTGGPGTGKTSIVMEVCEKLGAKMILSHPAQDEPTDYKGMPFLVDGKAMFVAYDDLEAARNATELTVWFLDDLGHATNATQTAAMKNLSKVGLPDCVTFVAATNRRSDRAGVTGLLEPVKSRFATIVELEPDLDEFCEWGLATGRIDVDIVACLRFRREIFYDFKPTLDLVNSPQPRTWEYASRLLALGMRDSVLQAALAGAVGPGAATELMGFRRMKKELPSLDQILLDPDTATIPKIPAALYAVCAGLASRTTQATFPRIARYLERMYDAGHAEFATLLVRDALRVDGSIAHTKAFVTLAAGDLGQMILGGDR